MDADEPLSPVPSAARPAARGGDSEGDDGMNIRVYLRVRPMNERENAGGCRQCLVVDVESKAVSILAHPQPQTFTYDHVAGPEISQEEVFQKVGKPITDSCLSGYNGTIFAYGQTGSGKTFTVQGPQGDNAPVEKRGLMPRVFDYLCGQVAREMRKSNGAVKFFLSVSFLEIYNDQIYDLLEPQAFALHIHEDPKKGVYVANLSEVSVQNAADCAQVLRAGVANRTVGETAMNRESSRSHCVFTIAIKSIEQRDGVTTEKYSRFNLIDLAGSERQRSTAASGIRLVEATRINRSLSALGNVIMALVDIARGKDRHVHYRDSKLTFLLKDSLGGNSLTYIVACVSSASDSFGETLSTLKFAARAKFIKNKAKINQDATSSLTSLQEENDKLKRQIRELQALASTASRRLSVAFITPRRLARGAGRGDEMEEGGEGEYEGEESKDDAGTAAVAAKRRKQKGNGVNGERDEVAVSDFFDEALRQSLVREQDIREENEKLRRRLELLERITSQQEKRHQSVKFVLTLRERALQRMAEELRALRAGEEAAASVTERMLGAKVERLEQERVHWEEQMMFSPAILQKTMELLELEDHIAELEAVMSTEEAVQAQSRPALKAKLQETQDLNFELSRRLERLGTEKASVTRELEHLRSQLRSPSKALGVMATPIRKKVEMLQFDKWKASEALHKQAAEQMRQAEDMVASLRAELEAKAAELREAGARTASSEQTRAELQRSMESLQLRLEAEKNRLADAHTADLEDLRRRAEDSLRAVEETHHKQLAALKAAYEERVSQLRKGEQASAEVQGSLAVQLAEARTSVETVQSQLVMAQNDLRAATDAAQRAEERFQTRAAELTGKLTQAKEEGWALQAELKRVEEEKRTEVAKLCARLAEGEAEKERLMLAIQHEKHRAEALGAEMTQARLELEQSQEHIAALDRKFVQLREQLDAAQGKIASLEQVVECKGAEIDQLQFNSEMLEEDHETLLQKFSFQEKQIETLRTENATLKRAVEEEKSASSARVQRAGELEDSVTKLQTQLQAALKGTADVSELMHEKLALQLELKAAKEAHVSQGQLLEHARGQLEVAEAKAREASAKFVSEHEVREQVSKAFAALQERHAKAVAQLEHLTQQSSQAQSALQEAQSDLESRAAEQLRMETRIAELEKALVDAEGARGEEVDKVLQELENYRKQLADADVARHAMHKSNKALEAALADAKREHAAAIQALRESAAHERAAAEVSLAQLRGELAQGREKSSERDAMNEKLVASLRAECQSLRSAMAAAQQDTRAAKAHATTLEARLSEITSLFAASESSSTASVVGGVEASPVRGARQALQVMEAKRSEISRQLAEMRSNHEQEVAFLQAELRAANADKAAAAHAQSAAQADVEQSRKESRELQDKLKALRAELRAKEESFVRLSTDMEKSMQAKNSEMEKTEAAQKDQLRTQLEAASETQSKLRAALSEAHGQCEAKGVQLEAMARQLRELRTESEARTLEAAQMAAEVERLRNEMSDSLRSKDQWMKEMQRCREEEERAFQSSQEIKAQTEKLREDYLRLTEEVRALHESNEELSAQNTMLIGHQNPKQKIQLHMKIKKENDQLKLEKSSLERELRRLRKTLRSHVSEEVLSKENAAPDDHEENVEERLRAELAAAATESTRIRTTLGELRVLLSRPSSNVESENKRLSVEHATPSGGHGDAAAAAAAAVKSGASTTAQMEDSIAALRELISQLKEREAKVSAQEHEVERHRKQLQLAEQQRLLALETQRVHSALVAAKSPLRQRK